MLKLYEAKYADDSPTLAAEFLASEERILVSVEMLRQWLLAAGLWRRRRRQGANRLRCPPREHRGELVQMDGSHHDWFEERRDGPC